MKILFLRIGIDRGCGGTLSPINADGCFEYVPIPESKPLLPGRAVLYSHIPARSGGSLLKFVSRDQPSHFDPEFGTFTYGEPNNPKRLQLLRLTAGDYLVFYAGFQGPAVSPGTCFVIGLFKVREVHSMPDSPLWPPSALNHLANNAHLRRANAEPTLVIVEGDKCGSKLFQTAAQLSDENQKVLPKVSAILGISGSVRRAVGRWVPETHLLSASSWLESLK